IWFNERWRLTRIGGVGVPLVLMLYPRGHYDLADLPDDLAAELGLLTTRIVRHVQALPHISRAHVYRIGAGGAHLHVWVLAPPRRTGPAVRVVARRLGRSATRVPGRRSHDRRGHCRRRPGHLPWGQPDGDRRIAIRTLADRGTATDDLRSGRDNGAR